MIKFKPTRQGRKAHRLMLLFIVLAFSTAVFIAGVKLMTDTTLYTLADAVTVSTRNATDIAGAKIPLSQKGAINGVASLNADGKVPASQLPAEAGLGDVSGPTSATDGDLVTFDGTTGKLVKGGGAPITTPAWPVAGNMVVFEETNNGRKLADGGNVQSQMSLALVPLIVAAGAGTSELNVACIGTNSATAHQITGDYVALAQAGGNGLSGVTLPAATGAGEVVYVAAPLLLFSMAKIYAAGSDTIDGDASTLIANGAPGVKAFKSNAPGAWVTVLSMF